MSGNKMDDIYRVQRHFYDLTRKPYLLGRDVLIRELDIPDGGSVLEIGCGTRAIFCASPGNIRWRAAMASISPP